ncbi:urease [Hortaea werneckii]|nr:urease [Hortaea werneckii]
MRLSYPMFCMRSLIRDGRHSVSDLMTVGAKILGTRNVDSTVISTITGLQVEGTFPTGTHLVTVDHPISTKDGNLELAMYGSCLTPPPPEVFPSDDLLEDDNGVESRPGAIVCAQSGGIKLREGRPRRILRVVNQGDRAIQIGSHFHFIEANPYLEFDRLKAYGYHLDIPAGTSVRFEPGEAKTVSLSEIGGLKTIRGGSSIAPGRIDLSRADDILRRIEEQGFYHTPETTKAAEQPPDPYELDRRTYSSMYGPTVGDLVRLSSTDLWIKVEEDLTTKGDECTFGGGKTLRDGIGQASGRSSAQCLDLVITNALIVDWSGIMKADIGIKGGCIVGIGKAGNPDTMDRVNPAMIVGSGTDVIAGEGKIITAGAIDTHCHFICPQQADEALAAGITTQFSGGTGPSTATIAANCTPGQDSIRRMMQACDRLPLNYGLLGKGSDTGIPGLRDQIQAGVAGLKVHEDWGCTPASISNCLR